VPDYSETIPAGLGHHVYRLWAADGTCLYVGCAGERRPRRVRSRLAAHKHEKPWWPQVARIEVATFLSAAEVVAEETAQITRLKPAYNKTLLSGGAPAKTNWAAYYAKHPEAVAAKRDRERARRRRLRLSGSARAAIAKRRPGPGQGAMWT
jgi:hypothetical protein